MAMDATRAPIGTAIVVLTRAHPGTARDLNRWYEEDHFYVPAMSGPGAMAGARFVATRECKAARIGDGLLGPLDAGDFLSLYWVLAGMQERWDAWLVEQEPALRADDRWDFPKDQLYSGITTFAWESSRPGASPAIVALDRSFGGVVLVAVRCDADADLAAFRAWTDDRLDEDVPLCVGLRPRRPFKTVGSDIEPLRAGRFALAVFFTEGSPVKAARRLTDDLHASGAPGVGPLAFVGPFLRLDPGTERHLDELD